jgi:hypothetical protein
VTQAGGPLQAPGPTLTQPPTMKAVTKTTTRTRRISSSPVLPSRAKHVGARYSKTPTNARVARASGFTHVKDKHSTDGVRGARSGFLPDGKKDFSPAWPHPAGLFRAAHRLEKKEARSGSAGPQLSYGRRGASATSRASHSG